MRKISKETKMDLLESSKRVVNSLSFEDIRDIDLRIEDYTDRNDERKETRVNIDILFYE